MKTYKIRSPKWNDAWRDLPWSKIEAMLEAGEVFHMMDHRYGLFPPRGPLKAKLQRKIGKPCKPTTTSAVRARAVGKIRGTRKK